KNAALRPNRSMNDAAKTPAIPALIVYDETIRPNCDEVIASVRFSCGPSGITTIKSMMLVNCTDASRSRSIISRAEMAESFPPFAIIRRPPQHKIRGIRPGRSQPLAVESRANLDVVPHARRPDAATAIGPRGAMASTSRAQAEPGHAV